MKINFGSTLWEKERGKNTAKHLPESGDKQEYLTHNHYWIKSTKNYKLIYNDSMNANKTFNKCMCGSCGIDLICEHEGEQHETSICGECAG